MTLFATIQWHWFDHIIPLSMIWCLLQNLALLAVAFSVVADLSSRLVHLRAASLMFYSDCLLHCLNSWILFTEGSQQKDEYRFDSILSWMHLVTTENNFRDDGILVELRLMTLSNMTPSKMLSVLAMLVAKKNSVSDGHSGEEELSRIQELLFRTFCFSLALPGWRCNLQIRSRHLCLKQWPCSNCASDQSCPAVVLSDCSLMSASNLQLTAHSIDDLKQSVN